MKPQLAWHWVNKSIFKWRVALVIPQLGFPFTRVQSESMGGSSCWPWPSWAHVVSVKGTLNLGNNCRIVALRKGLKMHLGTLFDMSLLMRISPSSIRLLLCFSRLDKEPCLSGADCRKWLWNHFQPDKKRKKQDEDNDPPAIANTSTKKVQVWD